MVKRLVLASPRGYCAGVERAVETVERALELHGAPVYVRKQIVHNAHVVRDLERRGAVFVDTVGEVPAGSNVVFSAHGVSPAVRHSARFRGLRAIDATCPLVSKVHVEARHFARLGYTIFLIGHAGHEEVEGTTGEAPQSILLVETAKQAETVVPPQTEKLVYLTQTTLSVGRYRRDRRDPPPPFPGRRGAQEGRHLLRDDEPAACRETNSLVIGSRNSSNSNRLVDVSRAGGVDAYLIDDESEIDEAWLDGVESVGLTSGASAPESLVRRVVGWFRERGVSQIESLDDAFEDVFFKLPRESARTRSPGRSGHAAHPLAGTGEENDRVAVGKQRGNEPALVGEPEPAAEAPRRDLEGGQEPALAPELDRGLDRLLGREPVDRERHRAVRRGGEMGDVEGLAALEARESGVDRRRAQVLAAVVEYALAGERPDGDVPRGGPLNGRLRGGAGRRRRDRPLPALRPDRVGRRHRDEDDDRGQEEAGHPALRTASLSPIWTSSASVSPAIQSR